MINFLIYLVEVSCGFSILYLVYYLIFSRLTFHGVNRTLLLLMLPVSLIIPVLKLGFTTTTDNYVLIPKFEEFVTNSQTEIGLSVNYQYNINISAILITIYCIGLLFFVYKFALNAFKLILLKQTSTSNYDNGFVIISAKVSLVFSCFKWIYIPDNEQYNHDSTIIGHEKTHARLWHSVDLILTEMFIAFFWFNPFVYFFRKSIKLVHEYQVDAQFLSTNATKGQYLRLMLDSLEHDFNLIGLYNYFNGLTIKNRIEMITKNKSSKVHLFLYFFIIPVIALLSMSFARYNNEKPEIFPVKDSQNAKISVSFGENMTNPFTKFARYYSEKPEIFPVKDSEKSKISVSFGQNMTNPFTKIKGVHNGIDIVAFEGTAVLASAGGKVKKAVFEKGWGNLIVIDHGEGIETWYAHLKNFAAKEGDIVTKGQTIGAVGSTGYSTGAHLHFEIRQNGQSVDPMNFINK